MDMIYGERIGLLGSGSYGKVHLVKIISSDSWCGRLIAEKSCEEELGESLVKEKEILEQFPGSPHIIQTYGCSTSFDYYETKVFSLFLELANGGNLLDLMADYGGKIPEQHVKSYAQMILKALVEIDSRGLVHSDLKPANILVFHHQDCNTMPILKIADFGLVKLSGVKDTDSWEYGFRGTAPYMSPESINGEISGALDVWSLGCIIIEMITGQMAWNYRGIEDLREKLLSGKKPEIPQNMSVWGKDFLERCLARDANRRWSARRLLYHPFLLLQPIPEMVFLPHQLMSSTRIATNFSEESRPRQEFLACC
ncbi:hypothetical protein CCACVL1_09173 [Corchorus capsularis]|uniref:Protein kinase domain-containing protein n=1 Tax=Corchorus capsularis TaxID=210143 RepID=A0A1R3IXG5_COCAP|nr:hypothetical protein CCACVL1_09173 [Corchorus capsularis]